MSTGVPVRLLLLLCFAITGSLWGQVHPISAPDRSAERSVVVDDKVYAIYYKYSASSGLVSIPATIPLGRRHYQALVTVYEKSGKDLLFLNEGRGVYVEGEHCFEDDPDQLVRAILGQLKQMKEQPKPEGEKK